MKIQSLTRALTVLGGVLVSSVTLALPSHAVGELEPVGHWGFGPSSAVDVDPVRDLIFLAAGGDVLVLDGADPTAPLLLCDDIRTVGLVSDLFYDVDDRNLYVAGGEGGLEIWNLDDPMQPVCLSITEVYYFDVETPVRSVEVYGNEAITENSFGYVHSLDVSDPTHPVDVAFNGMMGNPSHHIHVSQADGQVHSTGAQAYVRLNIGAGGALTTSAYRLFTYGAGAVFGTPSIAYVGYAGALYLLDLFDPTLAPWSIIDVDGIADLVVEAGYAYIINDDGFRIVDVAMPTSPSLAGFLSYPYLLEDLAVSEDYAYVAAGHDGLLVVDVSDPDAPAVVGTYEDVGSYSWQTEVVGGYAYVANSDNGLTILDVADQTAPIAVGGSPTAGAEARDVLYEDGLVYAAEDFDGLRILDVADPAMPAAIGSLGGFRAWRLAIDAPYLYVVDVVANERYYLRVIDVSDPANPAEVGAMQFQEADIIWEIVRAGDYLYVAGNDSGLRIVDISQPTAPVEIGSYALVSVTDLTLRGERLYVASHDPSLGGVFILDVSSPESPQQVGAYDPDWFAPLHLDVAGDYIYVSDGDEVTLIDASVPASPVLLDAYTTPGGLTEITANGAYVFVSDGAAGVRILRNQLIETTSVGDATGGSMPFLRPAVPTPFAVATTIRYRLPQSGPVRLEIYEPSGRLVNRLLDRVEPAGEGSVRWDGTTAAGRQVEPGVYLYRLELGGEHRTGRIVRVR